MKKKWILLILATIWLNCACETSNSYFYVKAMKPEELKINLLEELFQHHSISEIIIATSPTVNGEATSSHIASIAQNFNIKATRIAYGIPFGGEIEYVDSNTLIQAIVNRNTISD